MPRIIDPNVQFDREMSEHYDSFVQRLIPDYVRIHELVVAQLGLALEEHARVLVVGAGTCTEILTLADFDQTWIFTAVEPSAPMVDVARARIEAAGLSDRVEFHVGTIDTLEDQGPFDAATAILMMQFVPVEEKAAVFNDISTRLKPQAPLVMAHMIGDPDSDEHALAMQAWRDHMEETLKDRASEVYANVSDTLHFMPDNAQTTALKDVGFTEVVRFHTKMVFGAWIAIKG
ncbi:MAG: class I SAM-dependent methyltransferase [Rhodospirillaceae bacterium]|jgi:tRNA (cmo5U34)-methyltransferase|nr:class I SAM-dependent methyltransferase [Rhodospirillaceae bacterium]MBT5565088.1 class I SAM-dependent methyltransferase [Rhodospirillaceae bacterium]MBT6088110.1 class I SAM-dependent methyltransferase [Rhodospirillaceae bacterium]